jgi:hypothetical protein
MDSAAGAEREMGRGVTRGVGSERDSPLTAVETAIVANDAEEHFLAHDGTSRGIQQGHDQGRAEQRTDRRRLTTARDSRHPRRSGSLELAWSSSTGNLADLAGCQIGEQVVYPTHPNSKTYTYPPPFNMTVPNPTFVLVDARLGTFNDDHSRPPIQPPCQVVSSTSQQRYIYIKCPCDMGPKVLAGIWPINRAISIRPDKKFKYVITKNGLSASDDPLP